MDLVEARAMGIWTRLFLPLVPGGFALFLILSSTVRPIPHSLHPGSHPPKKTEDILLGALSRSLDPVRCRGMFGGWLTSKSLFILFQLLVDNCCILPRQMPFLPLPGIDPAQLVCDLPSLPLFLFVPPSHHRRASVQH